MRKILLALPCVLALAACAYLGAAPGEKSVKVLLSVRDKANGKPTGGMVRVYAGESARPLELPGLLDRLRGVKPAAGAEGWYVVPVQGGHTTLPVGKLRLEAVSGLESAHHSVELDTGGRPEKIEVELDSFFRPEEPDLVAGNTHLHLMKLTKEEAEDYLKQVPAADRLRVLFISYLERHKDDATYITNRYPVGDLPEFNATGVLVNNGQEHRHNIGSHGEGYGHVMFLGIKQLVRPVSLGPGITGSGNDDRPLRPGIDEAKKQGGTVIWCHNGFGTEDVVSALSGRLDALNVHDGSRRGSFEDNYYRYLNVGLRLPISTGTDWFLYDFSRVYARVPGKLSPGRWLDALKMGRNQATNGPLLSLTVDGSEPGAVIELAVPKTLRIEARARGRHDLCELQLVHNGKVIARKATAGKLAPGKRHYEVRLAHEVRVEEPSWFAVRVDAVAKNELGNVLFAHTSPIYVAYQGKNRFDVDTARALLKELEESQGAIRAQGKFSDARASANVLSLYEETARQLRAQINRQP